MRISILIAQAGRATVDPLIESLEAQAGDTPFTHFFASVRWSLSSTTTEHRAVR
ncbi:MAG: hypothetical protein AAGF61_02680 [Pseudomonadota bacterium]